MDRNDKDVLSKLWEDRHTHDDDPDFQEQIDQINITIFENEESGSVGAHIHLTRAATQSIDATGELISWDTEYSTIPRLEFHPQLSDDLPLTEITIPKDGYYDIRVELEWDSFEGGGTVRVVRNPSGENETVWPPGDQWTADSGPRGKGTAGAVPFKSGDTVGVFLSPDDASAQDLASALLTVDLVDRTTRTVLYHQAVLADGPLAYWRLDETSGTLAEDTAGHASGPFDMTYTNTPDLGEAGVMDDGSGNGSVAFDGTKHVAGQDWADMDFASGEFSLEAWFNSDGTGNQIIIEKKNQDGATDHGWELSISTTVAFLDDGSSGFLTGGTLTADETHHVVVTHDGTTTILYLDGVAVDSDTGLTITANTQIVSIARDTAAAGLNFDGHIDEVAVYDRALEAHEVEEHYNIGSRFL